MKIAVIYEEDNGDKSVWYPDVTEQEWCDAVDGFSDTGSSTCGTLEQIFDDIRDAFYSGR
jgi:hypothetical protein